MIFVTHIKNAGAAKDYYSQHLSPGDYYGHDAQEMKGEWHGRGAELLGLAGEVQQKDYFRLCDNIDPRTGRQLTPETKSNRRVLSDFTFDTPKSVSLVLEFGGEDGKGDKRVLEAFQESVRETMADIENRAMTRVRKGGQDTDRLTSNMVWSEHIHRTARPVDGEVDLQLHCHATVMNATYDPVEERWKAVQLGNIVRDKGEIQAAFHSRLAGKLSVLGYGIERDGNSFKLVGIDRATVEKFSRRSAVIDAEAEKRGISDPKAKGDLGRKTREKKAETPKTMAELHTDWKSRLTGEEHASIIGAGKGQETTTLNAKEGMDHAVLHCFERESVLTESQLLKTALIHSVGNASVEEVKAQLARKEIIRRTKQGQAFVTTQEVRREEMLMTAYAREGRGKFKPLARALKGTSLGTEHEKAANIILGSRDAVTVLRGGAGTGKTTLMRDTVKAIESTGKRVFTFAPSADASRGVLQSEGFKDADTVEKLLTDQKLHKQLYANVIWVDEAGLISTPDMKRIFELASEHKARVVLSGDTSQHHAVRRGDALRILQRDAGLKVAELKTVRRQTNEDYRRAITAISEGSLPGGNGKTRFQEGLEILDGVGAIKEAEGKDRYTQIAADYLSITAQRKLGGKAKTAIVISPTHAESDKVTQQIREALKAAGKIKGQEGKYRSLRALGFTEAQRGDFGNYMPGQVVRWNQNARNFIRGETVTVTSAQPDRLEVTKANGTTATVLLKDAKRFDVFQERDIALAAGDKVRITMNGKSRETRRGVKTAKSKLNNGDIFEVKKLLADGDIETVNGFVIPNNYGGISNGFVITSHASQGKTTDYALVALGQESFAAANREQLYVSLSRGREGVKLYTDDKAAMFEAVRSSSARMSASELLGNQNPIKKPSVMARLIGMQRIRNAYQAVRERMTWIPPQQEVRRGIRL